MWSCGRPQAPVPQFMDLDVSLEAVPARGEASILFC